MYLFEILKVGKKNLLSLPKQALHFETIHTLRQHNLGLFLTHPPIMSALIQQNWPFSRPTLPELLLT